MNFQLILCILLKYLLKIFKLYPRILEAIYEIFIHKVMNIIL